MTVQMTRIHKNDVLRIGGGRHPDFRPMSKRHLNKCFLSQKHPLGASRHISLASKKLMITCENPVVNDIHPLTYHGTSKVTSWINDFTAANCPSIGFPVRFRGFHRTGGFHFSQHLSSVLTRHLASVSSTYHHAKKHLWGSGGSTKSVGCYRL